MVVFSNREMLMLFNELTNRVKGSYLLMNFKRNTEGFQGMFKIPFKRNSDYLIFYLERKVNSEEPLEEDYKTHLTIDVMEIMKKKLLNGIENLFNPNTTKLILVSSLINEKSKKNLVRIYLTSLNVLVSMVNFMKYNIPIKDFTYKKWSFVEEFYTEYNEVIRNKLVSGLLLLIFEK